MSMAHITIRGQGMPLVWAATRDQELGRTGPSPHWLQLDPCLTSSSTLETGLWDAALRESVSMGELTLPLICSVVAQTQR